MLLLTSYVNAPGHCRICQSAVTPIIDTQRDYDSDGFGGVLYICANCVATMADLMGWMHPSKAEDLQAELERVLDHNDSLQVETADIAAQLESIKELVQIVEQAPVKRGPGRPRKAAS